MRVLFDSNVWLAAEYSPSGVCRRVIDATVVRGVPIIVCATLLADVAEKLVAKFRWSPEDRDEARVEGASQ